MNRAKEIINKRIINTIRSFGKSMPKLFSVGMASLLGLIPLAPLSNRGIMAYAQQQAQAALDPWSEALRTAQSKVEAATTPSAFGHGVPSLYEMAPQDILLVVGVAAMGGILVYVIANYLLNNRREKATESDRLIASAA